MPRKSKTSLTVVPMVPGTGRPPPPREFDDQERRVWQDIIAALPSHWIDLAGEQVLRRAVCLAANLEKWETRLRELRAGGADQTDEAVKLAIMHGNTAKVVTYLLAQLRATPRSRGVPRAAASKIGETPKIRPWEIRGSHGSDPA